MKNPGIAPTAKAEMKTPVCDFVNNYIKSNTARFHIPGHKGRTMLGFEPYDITEIEGAGDLYAGGGIIAESEANAASLFGFKSTLYSTEGSSQCIKAMLYLAKLMAAYRGNKSGVVLAGHNAHKAFIQGCALNDIDAAWLYPENGDYFINRAVTPINVLSAIKAMNEKPMAVYLTSPDYYGGTADIAGVACVCREYEIPLLVDNAHGAYLRFLNPSAHPISLGAAMSCDSAHKTLLALTGGAYLQISGGVPDNISAKAKAALSLFGSTSPSYLILQSLDLCNAYIAEGYGERLAHFIKKLGALRSELAGFGWEAEVSDPLRLVFDSALRGYTGRETAALLRDGGVECEFADGRAVVLMTSPENTDDDLKRLIKAFKAIPKTDKKTNTPAFTFAPLRKAVTIRKAVMSVSETVTIEKSVGRICALPAAVCPPGVPIVTSGEVIDARSAVMMRESGIKTVEVVVE